MSDCKEVVNEFFVFIFSLPFFLPTFPFLFPLSFLSEPCSGRESIETQINQTVSASRFSLRWEYLACNGMHFSFLNSFDKLTGYIAIEKRCTHLEHLDNKVIFEEYSEKNKELASISICVGG